MEIYLQNETVWLTQQKIAELFGVQRPAVTKHLKNIFNSGELKEDSVSSILEHTAVDGKLPIDHQAVAINTITNMSLPLD